MRALPSPVRQTVAVIVAVAMMVLTVAAVADSTVRPVTRDRVDTRGQVVWSEPLRALTPAATRTSLRSAGYDAGAVTHGVRLYRLVYRTVGTDHRPTVASGLLALPTTSTRTLSTVLFEHGTISYRGDAPSSLPKDLFASAPALAYAAAGYAAVAPDYLGLGVGPGPHPWFDVDSETTASVDLLRAARTAVAAGRHRLGHRLLVTGFSQGASAALATAHAIRAAGSDSWFRVAGLAPVSGGYAFRRVELPALLDGRISPATAVPYTAYLLTAWQRLHHVYRDSGQVFRAPYAPRVDALFGSDVPGTALMQGLPRSIDGLLTPAGRQLLARPTGRFAAALAHADGVCSWRPSSPVRLYYAAGDEQALTANTTVCRAELGRHGAAVRTVDLGRPDHEHSRHLGSGVAGVAATITWFRELVRPAA